MNTTTQEFAPAKINLTLDVLDKRPDGYHNIRSIMQTISIRDDIALELNTGAPWRLECDKAEIPTDESNLAWKAARVFCDALNKDPNGLTIRITKRIPSGAGMGGGSADAAAVLRALNRYYEYPLSIPALAELGSQVGSDVPFCVIGGTAMVEGRGEKVRSLPRMPETIFVVCKPEFSVSTPELYRKLDEAAIARRPDHKAMERAILAGEPLQIAQNLCNVFDPVVTESHLELNYIKSIMNAYGGMGYVMTGSGSAVYTMVSEFEIAAVICSMLKDSYPQVFIAKTV